MVSFLCSGLVEVDMLGGFLAVLPMGCNVYVTRSVGMLQALSSKAKTRLQTSSCEPISCIVCVPRKANALPSNTASLRNAPTGLPVFGILSRTSDVWGGAKLRPKCRKSVAPG